ncbi:MULTISPECIES: hybrid sensor histidine kinase/response regulator [Paraburkholderia]|uniref:hybrid sensor histidine kinase/response regulator n=1 Tax=Paraburkholderia TaxID=1822464 RepID=UPI002257791F|nr:MULTISPECIES: hybrid sensor histidine kinase/response regulator [Paraburkholderia]MCX4153093.1 hybrid sensor histidine kinase/response regulator [Paraburkholderia aspalathi]MDN7162507.1 hybrid sensor histidine kinase/response regulator [Paraburkholderia sp. SECH2]MDQ6390993.1 hybrid sensor histidine kinase/response regulator [Paraburkholderia aspalathi]
MRSSGLRVRRFSSAAQERAFRMDYARRFFGQRRLAITIFTALWVVFSIHDFGRLDVLDPSHLHHNELILLRVAGAIGMTVSVLLWSRRALDERWAVGLLSAWTISCWFAVLRMVQIYPDNLAWREAYPVLTFALFMIFMALRLRVSTAAWLIGLCIVSYLVMLYLRPSGQSVNARMESVIAHATMVPMMYIVGVLVSIPLERAARREFIYRRTLRAAKARVEAASRAVNEQNKRMQELVKEKERFFSSAYHDIQQPLAAINLFIRSARTRIKDGYAVDRELDVIEETASDILDMFKDIQDYSELGSYVPHVVPVDTRGLLTEVFEQYRETARLRGIDLRIAGRRRYPPSIETDRSLFKRSVSNLVSNAIKNTSSGGVVLGWVQLNERLRVDVWDTGIGIAPAHREAIFSEYYQINNPGRDRSKGLGLGLSIVHRAIHILPGHSMSFASVEGRGSRFSLYATVSASTPIVGAHAQDSDVYTPDLTGTFMLLCDDEPTVLEGLRRLFSSAGALVYAADSMAGFEAILADDSRIPDLIVADIRLRDGATGKEVASRIRRHFAWAGVIPVAFITGELLSDHVLRDFPKPFVLLRKSSAPKDLLAEISRYVSAQRKMKFDLANDQ